MEIECLFTSEAEVVTEYDITAETEENTPNEILSKMTLEEKIGQMLCLSFNGTEYNDQLKNLIEKSIEIMFNKDYEIGTKSNTK